MRRLLRWLDKYLLEIGVAVLLVFIPLYPKFPLIDIPNTWVYVRVEDFLVALVTGIWLIQLLRRKISLRIPLALAILFYWLVGGISLLFALIFLRPHLADFSPNVAGLHYFRRIEYMIVFFIAFSTVKDLKTVKRYLVAITLAVIGVCLYGFGQKFLGFPAFLTMNEEFSKGIPLYLPPTARITSTFGGHYDLAAYLVLIIALLGSLIFGLKNWFNKMIVFLVTFAGFILLLFTASRISFMAYLLAVSLVLLLQRKKWLIAPVLVVSFFLMNYVTGASQRFGKTFRIERVVYDVRTGRPIATLEEEARIGEIITEEEEIASEELPLGTGYISLPSAETPEATQVAVIKKPILTSLKTATKASEIAAISGEFLIKRAIVYDISFTTRFQGTWPRAMEAFRRNLVLGSGYSSIGLATDNSYLRALGETGLLGFFAFLALFSSFFLLVKQGLVKITSSFARSILIGVGAGLAGLMFNAVLIDVFEASKVAFPLWILIGMATGVINFYLPRRRSLIKEAIKIIKLPPAPIIVLVLAAPLVFASSFGNYFVGDDFTWLRWAATSKAADIPQFFLSAQGFFYRPLAKVYFFLVNPFFGLRPQGYHAVDLLLHLGCALAAYFLVLTLTKKRLVASLAALFFLIHPVNAESVFWISTTSHLLASLFYLWGLLAYIMWREVKRRWRWLFFTLALLAFVLGLFSHERMVTFPLIIIFYDLIFFQFKKSERWTTKLAPYLPFWFLIDVYFWLRNTVAQAHGLSGDYSYNFKNLAFNFVGNSFGYLGELTASFHFLPLYNWARLSLRSHKMVVFLVLVAVLLMILFFWKRFKLRKWWDRGKLRLVVFSFGWFVILLLPFLGLGNISERYLYPAHLGFFLVVGLIFDGIYQRLRKKNANLALVIVGVVVVGLTGFYLRETEKAKQNWYQAGETANKTLLALGSNYAEFPSGSALYFVNLPIRQGRAWVFPVGLEDGIWFIYRDENLTIKRTSDLENTLDLAKGRPNIYVFLYQEGELKEARK